MKKIFTILICLIGYFQVTPVLAQDALEKVFEKSFDIGTDGDVEVIHRRGPLRVERINGSTAKMKVVLKAKKGTKEAFQALVDNFDLKVSHNGNQLKVTTDMNIKNYRSVNGRTTITFQNGDKVKGLNDISADFLLQIPKVKSLYAENKYENIYLPKMEGDVSIKQYSADVIGNNIEGRFDLAIKYGKVKVGYVGDSKLNIYDGALEMSNANNVSLTSKYSKIKMGNLNKADLKTYDDNVTVGNVNTVLDIVDKYSDFEVGNFQKGKWQIYDATVDAGLVDDLKITSKYTEYEFEGVKSFDGSSIYDDEFKIGNLGDFSATSKYTEFDIGELTGHFKLASYDDEVDVDKVADSFSGLELSGKYTEIDLPISSSINYHLNVDMTYGEVDYAEDRFDTNIYIEKSSKLQVKGKTKGASANAAKIEIKEAYSCTIDLN